MTISELTITGTVASMEKDKNRSEVKILLQQPAMADPTRPPHTIEVLCTDDWAISITFVAVGDLMTVTRFDAQMDTAANKDRPFTVVLITSSEVHVERKKEVVINSANVGQLELLEPTGREDIIRSNRTRDVNGLSNVGRYYDVITGSRAAFTPKAEFIARVLGRRRRVPDAGCGTGLYAFFLRAFDVQCSALDGSSAMAEIINEKNAFYADVEPEKGLVPFYHTDITKFVLSSIGPTGEEERIDFEAVLCLDVLQMLTDAEAVRDALLNMFVHTAPGGILILSVPNAEAAVKAGTTQFHTRFPIDSDTRSLGASSAVPPGVLDVTTRVVIEDNVRTTEWKGAAFHHHLSTKSTMFVDFTETTKEILIPAGEIEELLTSVGYRIDALYGDLDGKPFDIATSPSRVYTLTKTMYVL